MIYGKLTAFVGPMFAGKTTKLLEAAKTEPNSILIKVAFDTRYGEHIQTHDGIYMPSVSMTNWSIDASKYDNFMFDEMQFFKEPHFHDDIVQVVKRLLQSGKNVYFSGLDIDNVGKVFIQPELLAMADDIYKLKARCSICGEKASKTLKKFGNDAKQFDLGSSDKYEARCNKHWVR